MLRPNQKIWDWDLIFGRAVKAISSLGVRSPWLTAIQGMNLERKVHSYGLSIVDILWLSELLYEGQE